MYMYYAHPMSWYGTPEEYRDMMAISTAGHKPFNPNRSELDRAVKAEKAAGRGGMEPFMKIIKDETDAIAVRPFKDGRLGAGVAKELFEAIIWSKPVYVLRTLDDSYTVSLTKEPNPRSLLPGVLTVAQTKERIRVGQL